MKLSGKGLLPALLLFACLGASADTLRCGSQLVSSGDRAFEVERKCGPPAQRDLVGYGLSGRNSCWRNGSTGRTTARLASSRSRATAWYASNRSARDKSSGVRMPRFALIALLVSLAGEPASASSTLRCNSRLVSLDASTAQVRERCGEPSSSAMIGYKEIIDEYGYRQEVIVEEWVYGPNHGMYHYLRFEGNRLRGIDSQRGN